MQFSKLGKNKRKAISPVLATVILIAITLIAAIAIAGFVFGLFGSFTSSAQVQASVVSCTNAAGIITCSLQLTNSGSANTASTGTCSLTAAGQTLTGITTGASPITAGVTTAGTCANSNPFNPVPAAGAQITGSLLLTNGASIPFTGTRA